MVVDALTNIVERTDVSTQKIIEVAQILYGNTKEGSEAWQIGRETLISFVKRSDISIQETIGAAWIFFIKGEQGTKERSIAAARLLELARRTDLSVEEATSLIHVIKLFGSETSEGEKNLIHYLLHITRNVNFIVEERLQAATVVLQESYRPSEKIQALQTIYKLMPEDKASQHIANHWANSYRKAGISANKVEISEIPCIIEMAKNEMLPEKIRDGYTVYCVK